MALRSGFSRARCSAASRRFCAPPVDLPALFAAAAVGVSPSELARWLVSHLA